MIAGKGHERGQEIAGDVIPFDDRDVAGEALRALRSDRVIPLSLAEVAELAPGRLEAAPGRPR